MAKITLITCLLFLAVINAASSATPDAITVDGGRYYGPLVAGKLHGHGRIEWDNGASYVGEFANGVMSGRGRLHFANGNIYEGEIRDGMMWGRGRYEVPDRERYEGEFKQDYYWGVGELRMSNGRTYRGQFVRGEMDGKGRLETREGDVYDGEFSKSEFTGTGSYKRSDGSRYEGQFRNWMLEGSGRFSDGEGTVWEGTFVNGQLQGPGKSTSKYGTYEGEFRYSMYHGRGVLKMANGDVYEGGFADGLYSGEGTLTYAKPKPDGRKQDAGLWRYGRLANDEERTRTRTNVETALYSQRELLDRALASLKAREPGRINLYLLAVAGYGSQEVFRREVEFVQGEFARRFGTSGRTIALVNSRNTVASLPMATVTSIREVLKAIGTRMNRDEDILFLFMTSHGSQEHEFSLAQNGMDLAGLRAPVLAELLKESGIRWKVVVVSACYSGGFINPLQDGRTLIITAARHDRRSFGCADENDFTYFGRAFFKESLPKATSFQDAFHKAEALVREWEHKDAAHAAQAGAKVAKTGDEDQSFPQISSASAIEAHLKRWWTQTAR